MKKTKTKPRRKYTAADLADVESPPLTEQELASLRPAHEVMPEVLALVRRYRGPQKRPTKELVSLRLDRDMVQHFRSRGKGWQSRINATLRKAAGL
jgi:uncharacterized protein (DUF4415 family)